MALLTQLRYFEAIVSEGSFTAAAQTLGVSQPTLTRSLQTLEFQLNVSLLERGRGVIACTPAGELLLRRARLLLAEHKSLVSDVRKLSLRETPVTYVNGSPASLVAFLPRIISHMAVHFPEFPIALRGDNGANYDWKISALMAGDLDVVLTLYDSSNTDENLQQELLTEPEMRVMAHQSHPANALPDATLADLVGYRWIMPPQGSSPRVAVDNEFTLQGLKPPVDHTEISDWRVALDVMKTGKFLIAIPYHPAYFSDQLDGLQPLPIRFGIRAQALVMVTRLLSRQRDATLAFAQTARQIVAEAGGVRAI